MSELFFDSLGSVARQLESKQISSVELTDLMLERIDVLNPKLNAYTTVTADSAREQARQADAEITSGDYKGPLHGVPIAVKDLLQTAGTKTTCGSVLKRDWVPTVDATVVAKLKQAGAVLLGKLNMTEFALSGYHPNLPVPVNPWAQDRWAGVSSSGSAVASAAGMAFGTLGSDTGGSIRFPSAVNGVVGIKPTFGTVSKHGAFPLAHTLDHVGPITRRVEDATLMLQAVAGFDTNDPFSVRRSIPDFSADLNAGVNGLKIGLDEKYCATDAHPEVTAAVLEASEVLAGLGAKIVPVDIDSIREVCAYWGAVVAVETALAHKQTFPAQADEYGPVIKAALEAAPLVTAADYAQARLLAAQVAATLNDALNVVDVLLCPGAPLPAMPLEDFPPTVVLPPEAVASFVGFSAPMNFSGHPTISVPCGQSSEGLPLGLQLVGRHHDETTLIRVAQAYEQATDWHRLLPPLQ